MPKRVSFTHLLGCLRPAQMKLGKLQRYLKLSTITDGCFLSLSMMGQGFLKLYNRIQKLYNFCPKLYNSRAETASNLAFLNFIQKSTN